MPVPTNTTAGTAIELGPLPNTLMQRVDDGSGTTYTVWYQITSVTAAMIGAWAFGDLTVYQPTLHIFESDGVTPIVNGGLGAVANKRMQFPAVIGNTYLLKITSNAGNPSPANLTISALSFADTTQVTVPGAMLINDDTWGMPGLVMDSTGTPRQFIAGMANGESGAILPSGAFLLTNDDEGAFGALNGQATIYGPDATRLATVTLNALSGNSLLFRAGASDTYFYVLDTNSFPTVLNRISASGTIVANVWSITGTAQAIAPSRDDSILYYSVASSPIIHRWDLVGNVGLSNLGTMATGYNPALESLLVLGDGTIVVGANHSSAPITSAVFRFDPTGTLLNTYDVSATGFLLNRIALNQDDSAASLQVWTRNAGTGTSRLSVIETAGGTVLATSDVVEFESGVYSGAVTATPTSAFGPSLSCPILVMRGLAATRSTVPSSPPVIPGTCCSPTPTSTSITSPKPSAGTNKGGVGSCTFYSGPSGVVPIGADPPDGDTLTGKRTVYVWAEVQHVDY